LIIKSTILETALANAADFTWLLLRSGLASRIRAKRQGRRQRYNVYRNNVMVALSCAGATFPQRGVLPARISSRDGRFHIRATQRHRFCSSTATTSRFH
jgi:hypothetical protein